MSIEAKVIEKSVSDAGKVITTLQLRYPRFIHAEFMTHRVFSRNASSSRAIPVAKLIEEVRTNPATPVHWGTNKPGMQAGAELQETAGAVTAWKIAAQRAADDAQGLAAMGLHKQIVNRVLEPFSHISVIVTATEWDNFYALRDHEDAQPEIRALAQAMRAASDAVEPTLRTVVGVSPASHSLWHLPYVTAQEREVRPVRELLRMSVARCARVSYLKHDGQAPTLEEDLALFNRLVGSEPIHASPTEHQAFVLDNPQQQSNNFLGWGQFRQAI